MNWVRFRVGDVELYAVFDEAGVIEVGGRTESAAERVVMIESEGKEPYDMLIREGEPFILQLGLGKELSAPVVTLGERSAV